jgi:2-polyprenyl-3-methyl-5-hydroxy-6-metoxy-1,4-benzoquinol methylase
MRAYYANARRDVLDFLPNRKFAKILEVGGGDFPTLLHLAAEHDAESWGVDIRSTDAPISRFIQGSLTDPAVNSQLPSQGFDLIVANDVIEHIEDTEAFLETLRDLLAPSGVIALSVPNARQIRLAFTILFRGTFPRRDAGLFDRTHIRWFCRRDVVTFAKAAGLTVVRHKGTGRLVPAFLSRTIVAELLALQNLFILRK